ncbi:MAG: HDOD domain-containing protein [Methylomonas sp.]
MQQSQHEITGNISAVLDHIQKLPSLPSIVMDILESISNDNIDINWLSMKIANDQALVAKVLRVANSPFYGLSGKIDSISRAISVLGFNSLRSLVMAASFINVLPHLEKALDWMTFWRHSIATAVCAKVLAKHTGLNPETAFTAGLLHDIGKLVIGVYFPQFFQADDTGTIESLQREREALGLDHAVLGSEVAKRWRFPLTIQQAIELHHTHAGVSQERTLTDVVYIANLFAHALDSGRIRDDRAEKLAVETWTRLELKSELLENMAGEAQQLYDSIIPLIA